MSANIGPLVIEWPQDEGVKPFDLIAIYNCGKQQGAKEMQTKAAALARSNTSSPAIWKNGLWTYPTAEEIANGIEALPIE